MQSREHNDPLRNVRSDSGPAANPLDYLFLLRPMILIPVWTFFLLGAHHAAPGVPPQPRRLLAGICSITAAFGAVYIINQIADRETDLKNRKLFLISHAIISVKAASIEAVLLIIASLAIGFFMLSIWYALLPLGVIALGAAYSLEPLRLKKRAVLDVCANAIGIGILNTLAGWIAIGAPHAGLHVLLPYPFAVASVHLTTTLADIEGDAGTGLRTSGVVLGTRGGRIVAAVLMICALAVAVAVDNMVALWAAVLSLPLLLIPVRRSTHEGPQTGVLLPAKVATVVFALSAGLLFLPYIPVLAVAIILTRIYYWKRFGMRYPSA